MLDKLKKNADLIMGLMKRLDGKVLDQVKLRDHGKKNECWFVQDLFPGKNYAAAIAFERSVAGLSYWHYLD